MEYFEITAITGGIFNAVLTLMVVRNHLRSRLHLAYLGWGAGLTTWNIAVAMMLQQKSLENSLFWAKMVELGVIFLPLSMLHVCWRLTRSTSNRWIPVLYGVHACLAASLIGKLYISGLRMTDYGYFGAAGPLFYVFAVLYTFETGWFLMLLIRQRRVVPKAQQAGVTSLMVGLFILVICGANDLLPIIGIIEYPGSHLHFIPVANLAANLYAVMIAYTILQHELMDIHITMSKVAARFVRLSFVFVIALLLLLGAWMFSPVSFNAFSFVASLVVVVVSTGVASVLFPRLFGSGTDLIERRILGDRFEYHDRIRAFIASVQESGDADQMLEGLDELLTKVVKVSGYQLVMIDDTSRKFTVLQEYPEHSNPERTIVAPDSPLLNYFRLTGAEQFAQKLPSDSRFSEEIEAGARECMALVGAEFCFPFMVSTEPFGILFLKERAEGKRYTATDISLLAMLARNLSLSLNQIRLKTQILQAQESELLGRMSRGMAHDMNNLVTPVQTLMQLLAEGIPVEGLRDELLPLATRSIDTLREYIREALFFSENARADFKLGRLDMVLAEAVAIVATRCEQKGIRMTLDAPGEALVEMDKSLIKRTITNVLGNAIDASGSGTEIRVELTSLEKTEPDRDWFRIRIIDQGEGIPADNLQRIFTPYFTTKNRGDEQRGFGLGLSICRKVVQLHGGLLKITSAPKKGTTVFIDLPDRQLSRPTPFLQPVS